MELVNQGGIFCLGIADDNIIIRYQKSIGDFTFCTEGLTGTGSTKNQSVRVFEFLPVHHN